jgi:hypothetical protein
MGVPISSITGAPDHREDDGRSRNTDVEGKRMIQALEAAGLAWLMFNGALLVLLRRDQAMQISRETIDRFKRAIGVCEN